MKRFKGMFSSGRIATVAALFGIALIALIAVPFVASADEPTGDGPRKGPTTVEQCDNRVAADTPRRDNFLDELVTDAVISADQATEIDARLDTRRFEGCVARIVFPRGTAVEATASATGTAKREVLGALVAGQSLSEFANEHGVDDASLMTAIMESPTAKATDLVNNSEIDQATADSILAKIEECVSEVIHKTDLQPRHPGAAANLFGDQL